MTDPIRDIALGTFTPLLRTLSGLLDKGDAHMRAKGSDFDTLAAARLAPDMFTLAQQVQFTCDLALDGVALLTGQPSPPVAASDASLDGLKGRIARTVASLENLPGAAFQGAQERTISKPLQGELVLEMKGLPFLRDWSLPNFYFHLVTAYDILRHNGVDIGKRDYLVHIGPSIRTGG
jgi:hypothetical protein